MKNTTLLFLLLLFLNSCTESGQHVLRRIETKVYILRDGFQQTQIETLTDNTYQLWVYKGGYNEEKITVRLEIDEAAIAAYNDENGTSYTLMPEALYELANTITLDNEKHTGFVSVIIKSPEQLQADYLLPVTIAADNENSINQSKKTVLLNLVN